MGTIRRLLAVGALAIGLGAPGALSAAAASPPPYCGITWGSLQKSASASTSAPDTLNGVRSGRHACYDRLVLDGASWARVQYVPAVRTEGKGEVLALRGGARLEIVTDRADDEQTGQPTYQPADPAELVDVSGYDTFRQVAFGGSFEGQSTLGLGVRARLPFRVFVLTEPGRAPRLVVDVAHRWS